MTKPLVIYHSNCADGFGAAWVFKRHSGMDLDFHPGVYSEAPPDVAGRDVYLVDFSYKRDVVKRMAESAARIVLIDHHKTAAEDLLPLIEDDTIRALVDMEHSGAMLAWKFFYNTTENAPQLLRHIEDRDLWRFALPMTREIQSNLFSHPYDFEVWDELMAMDPQRLAAEGAAISRKHMKDVHELLGATKHRRIIGGFNVPAANLPYLYASDAAHIMAGNGEFFAACYFDTPTHRVYSLRGNGAVDVSDIAKAYGGGGHPNAAGFKVPFDHELAGRPR